jgi:hypothetical protein
MVDIHLALSVQVSGGVNPGTASAQTAAWIDGSGLSKLSP